MVSSLFRNSTWTDSGLGFGFDLFVFWVEEWVIEGWGGEMWGIEKVKGCSVGCWKGAREAGGRGWGHWMEENESWGCV